MKAYGKKRVKLCTDPICCGDEAKTSKTAIRRKVKEQLSNEIPGQNPDESDRSEESSF